LLVWARIRTETPMYVSQQARADAIDAGSGRPAAVLLEDVRESAARFAAEARLLRPQDWQVTVGGSRRTHPAWYTLWRRLSETEIHHVDLEAGYGPADWPPAFVADCLPVVVGDLTGRDDTPTVLLRDSDTGLDYRIGPASLIPDPEPPGAVTVTGPGCEILAWLTGRNQGASLAADPAAPLPAIPAW
jgi:maleylpyruvate isomerase